MADTLFASSYIKSGRLFIRRHDALDARMADWKDGNALVTVERVSDPRSLALNKFYWGTVVQISGDFHGYFKEDMHVAWKKRLLRTVDTDHRKARARSTTRLNDRQMLDYMNEIRVTELLDYGVQIPEPGESIVDPEWFKRQGSAA